MKCSEQIMGKSQRIISLE